MSESLGLGKIITIMQRDDDGLYVGDDLSWIGHRRDIKFELYHYIVSSLQWAYGPAYPMQHMSPDRRFHEMIVWMDKNPERFTRHEV